MLVSGSQPQQGAWEELFWCGKGSSTFFLCLRVQVALNSSQDRTCSCTLEEAAMAILELHAGNPGTDSLSSHGDAIAKLSLFQLCNLINIPRQFP